MKLATLVLAGALFGIVDIVDESVIAVEVPNPRTGDVSIIHADTRGTGCVFTEGQAIPIVFDGDNNFVATCRKVLDKVVAP
mgnify:FL=1